MNIYYIYVCVFTVGSFNFPPVIIYIYKYIYIYIYIYFSNTYLVENHGNITSICSSLLTEFFYGIWFFVILLVEN